MNKFTKLLTLSILILSKNQYAAHPNYMKKAIEFARRGQFNPDRIHGDIEITKENEKNYLTDYELVRIDFIKGSKRPTSLKELLTKRLNECVSNAYKKSSDDNVVKKCEDDFTKAFNRYGLSNNHQTNTPMEPIVLPNRKNSKEQEAGYE